MDTDARKAALEGIANPDSLGVVWDTGDAETSRAAGTAVSVAYNIGANNPCANGGATYAWPTNDTSQSLHGTGSAVDADPVTLPASVTIGQDQAPVWPAEASAKAQFGAANITVTPGSEAQSPSYTISDLGAVANRDAFLETFFRVRSAARAGFVDLAHFQAP